jgi:PAS domain S-box-containing protein
MHLKLLKVHMNDTMQSLMGYDSTALIGRSLFEFHHVGDMPMCHKCYLDLIAKGEGVSGYYRFLRGNGKWVWLQSRAAIMYNSRTARAEYIVVTNYVINQDEALEQVASEGRCTDMSPGLYIPPDVPYPKHPPLDNPSVRAKQAAIEMLSKPEGSASSASDASDTVTEIVTDTEPSVTDTEPPTPSSDVSPYTHYIQNPPSVSSQFGPIIKPPTISPIADYVSEPDQCVPASIADPVTPDMIDGVRLPLHSRAPDVHHQGQSSMPTDVDLGYLGDYEMPSINPTSGSTVQKCPDQGVKSHVLPSGLVQPASVPYPGNMASHEYSQYVQYAPPAMDSSQRHPPQNQFDPSSMMDMNMPSNQFMPGDVSLNQVIQPSLDASQLQQSILLHAQNTDNTMYNMTGGYPMTPCHNSKKPYDQGVHQQQQSSTFQQQANKLHHQSEYSQQHSAPTQFSRKPVMVVNPIRHEISSSTPSTGLINNEPVNQNQSQNFTQQPNKPIYSQSCLYPNSLPVQAGMLPQPPPQELPNGQEQSNDVSELDIQQLESLFNSEDLQDLEELISSEMMGLGSMPLQPDSVTATAGGPGYPGAGLSSW